jgi:hypothetical protein
MGQTNDSGKVFALATNRPLLMSKGARRFQKKESPTQDYRVGISARVASRNEALLQGVVLATFGGGMGRQSKGSVGLA